MESQRFRPTIASHNNNKSMIPKKCEAVFGKDHAPAKSRAGTSGASRPIKLARGWRSMQRGNPLRRSFARRTQTVGLPAAVILSLAVVAGALAAVANVGAQSVPNPFVLTAAL